MDDRWILIGVSGGGKTSIGQALADLTSTRLHDFEDAFSAIMGEDASTYLVREGENSYQRSARKVALGLLEKTGVITLAPGVVLDPDVAAALAQLRTDGAVVVELFADISTLMRRTGLNAPRSVALGPTRRMLSELVAAHREAYKGQSDISLDTSLSQPRHVAERILAFTGSKGVS